MDSASLPRLPHVEFLIGNDIKEFTESPLLPNVESITFMSAGGRFRAPETIMHRSLTCAAFRHIHTNIHLYVLEEVEDIEKRRE